MHNFKDIILSYMIDKIEETEDIKIDNENNEKFYKLLDIWSEIIEKGTKDKIDENIKHFVLLYLKDAK